MGLLILGILTVCANSPVWGSLANSWRVLNTYMFTARIIKSELATWNGKTQLYGSN